MIKQYLNINAFFDYYVFNQKEILGDEESETKNTVPRSLWNLELSKEINIDIPKEVQEVYSQFRPTPLFRAKKFEKIIGTNCEIYIKDESNTFSGNHKANSAYLIAYLCKKDGIETITTETTGNWGIALAKAAKEFGIKLICFIDEDSNKFRPDRKEKMEKEGAVVKIVELDSKHNDLLTLSADYAINYTKKLDNACYIFGSVYGYFVIPQTIIGLEAKLQLSKMNKYPDIVVGSCGGGANILGTASAFIQDRIKDGKRVEVFSAESENCPILTKGVLGEYSVDSQNYYPLLKTYGIGGLINDGTYIGGLGSTIVAPAVAYFHSKKIIEAKTFTAYEAKKAVELFYKAEGKVVALETGYQLAGVMYKAKQNSKKIILVNISSGENDKQFLGGSNI